MYLSVHIVSQTNKGSVEKKEWENGIQPLLRESTVKMNVDQMPTVCKPQTETIVRKK